MDHAPIISDSARPTKLPRLNSTDETPRSNRSQHQLGSTPQPCIPQPNFGNCLASSSSHLQHSFSASDAGQRILHDQRTAFWFDSFRCRCKSSLLWNMPGIRWLFTVGLFLRCIPEAHNLQFDDNKMYFLRLQPPLTPGLPAMGSLKRAKRGYNLDDILGPSDWASQRSSVTLRMVIL